MSKKDTFIMESDKQNNFFEEMLSAVPRFPQVLSQKAFYPIVYRLMYLSRKMDELFIELFRKRYVRGTVIISKGNEATTVGIGLPFRPGADVIALLHRDLGAHLAQGTHPFKIICQYMANKKSPTHGKEGNVHWGDAASRRFPMISHLGNMLATVVGGVWAARQNGEEVFGLNVIGDGGSSTGDFHESLNLASVRKIPVLYIIENNYYAYSTPVKYQYNCEQLSQRSKGYGIEGRTIDGSDVWQVYSAVNEALSRMQQNSMPYLLECMTLRLSGHAAYDNAEYVPEELRSQWMAKDPIVSTRRKLREISELTDEEIANIERQIDEALNACVREAIAVSGPSYAELNLDVFAPTVVSKCRPFSAKNVRNGIAVNLALDYIMADNPKGFIVGQDVGVYGSAFKTCKGLIDKYGDSRVIDMPICESAMMAFALGASQTGGLPIVEFQFADFATDAVTSLGLNSATWYFRTGCSAPILVRMPCGGGLTLGAFHSAEFDGLWTRFPGLKILYPATCQETFEAIVAGFYDPNPCIVFEHKRLYVGSTGDINFDGNLEHLWMARRYVQGNDLTLVATGAAVQTSLSAVQKSLCSVDVWNPFVLQPLIIDPIIESVKRTGRLLVVQESGLCAGLAERIVAQVCRKAYSYLAVAPQIVCAPDIPVPFAPELENCYIPSVDLILDNIKNLLE